MSLNLLPRQARCVVRAEEGQGRYVVLGVRDRVPVAGGLGVGADVDKPRRPGEDVSDGELADKIRDLTRLRMRFTRAARRCVRIWPPLRDSLEGLSGPTLAPVIDDT